MELVKYKIVNYLLRLNIIIGKKLSFWMAQYEADDYAVKNEKLDLRTIPKRMKNLLLHDKDIIEARFEECKACEHFVKLTSQCLKCGCFMKVKTRVAGASCPVGKWDKVIIGDKKIVPLPTT